ncbi:MAG: TetR/AcrR family transcriptional regulator [Treponema sp.]|nr:TetR/AcrR family transcriptional regulator [Treponema sp.]
MAVAVEHDKRREKILDKALAVFMDDGFENATFQKIADRCGITRTILYLYFKNKREIFNFSLKQLLSSAEENINSIHADKSLSSIEKITKVLQAVFKLLEQNRQLLFVVLDYLLHLSKSDVNPEERVRRRTVKLRHILSAILIEGVKKGELKKCNLKTANDYLYSFVEAAIFQLAVLKRKNLSELKETSAFAIKQLSS